MQGSGARLIILETIPPQATYLLPGILSAPIHVRLDTTKLTAEHVPRFEALSYTWGSTHDSTGVYANESGSHYIAVTQNLASALRHLRYQSEPRVLWVDAICIDQQDLAERSSQVKRMADIFALTERVLVWLGPESHDSTLALTLIGSLGTKVEVNWLSRTMRPTSSTASEAHWADRNEELPYDEREGRAIANILERSWFERLWIWQEIWLANSLATVICGQQKILWKHFRDAVFCIIYKRWPEGIPRTSGTRRLMVYNLCRMSDYRYFDFLTLQTTHSKCSDPRDRVFALLSLLDPFDKGMGIEPDYGKDVSEVYEEIFLSYSRRKEDLQLFLKCELGDTHSDIPTWVPDWSKPLLQEGFSSVRAAANSSPVLTVMDKKILQISGASISTIKKIARHDISRDTADAMAVVSHEIHKLASQCRLERAQVEAFCSSLCCNFFSDRYYPQDDNYPDRQQSIDLISRIIGTSNIDASNLSANSTLFLKFAGEFLVGRSVFTTPEGLLGLAPNCAEPGDIVVVLLGCNAAMVLRPCGSRHYQAVGQAYCYNFMDGEALLGPLAASYCVVNQTDDSDGGIWPAYMDRESGNVQVSDPRLGPLPLGWTLLNHDKQHLFARFVNAETGEERQKDPRLTPEALIASGVEITTFELV